MNVIQHITLTDLDPSIQYACGVTPKGQWKWRAVDQKYVDIVNSNIDKSNALVAPKQPTPKPRKGKK